MSDQNKYKRRHSTYTKTPINWNKTSSTNFCSEGQPAPPLNNYSHIPMPKQDAHWNQSATTWRHTNHKYSFSKQSRFKDYSLNYTDIIEPQIPSTLNSKSCTFGKGNKKPISTVILRNARQKPGPDIYDMTSVNERPRSVQKGKTFGLSWRYYETNFLKHRTDVYARFQTAHNPPSKYQIREQPGSDKQKYTAYGRLKMYTSKMAQDKNWVPGPYHLVNDRKFYGTVGMNQRNFSFGERMDLSMPANNNPEAIYQIGGFCDKFEKVKLKNKKSVTSRTLSRV